MKTETKAPGTITVYKVRDMKTGLYSTGGNYPSWSKKGKTWIGIGPLKSHLTTIFRRNRTYNGSLPHLDMTFWEVVEFELVPKSAFPAAAIANRKKS